MKVHRFEPRKKEGTVGEKAFEMELKRLQARGLISWFRNVSSIGAFQRLGIDFLVDDFFSLLSFEVKTDFVAGETGNIVFELFSNFESGKPGWGLTSQADFLAIFILARKQFFFIPMETLRNFISSGLKALESFVSKNPEYQAFGLKVPLEKVEGLGFWGLEGLFEGGKDVPL